MEQDPNNSSLLLQDALDRASRIRREISQLKAHALAQGEVCGTPPGDGSVNTPPGRQAVALMDGQLQEVSLGLASATPTALQQFEGTLREPSAQASMVALPLVPHTVSGEEQVPPLSADSELPWKIMAVFPHAGSVGAAGAAATGHAAPRATTRSSTAPSRQGAAGTSRSAAGRALSPSKRAGGQQSRRSTLAQPADPGSVTGSIDFTALAAALQKEQQQGAGTRRSPQAAAGAARPPQPHRQPPSSLRKGPTVVPATSGAPRAFGAPATAGSSRQPLPQRPPSAAAAAQRSQAGAVRPPVRKVAQASASTATRASQQQWAEQESAHRRLLDNLQKANAIKQASDARMRASAAPAPSVTKAGLTKQPMPLPPHLRASIGVKGQQQHRQQQQQQQQFLREPKERVQPFVPRLEMSRIPPPPKLGSSRHGDEQPPTPQSATRQSRFSLAWLVQGEGTGMEGPRAAAGAAASAAGFMSDRSPVRMPPAASAWVPHTTRESPLRPQLQSRIPRPPELRLDPPAVLKPTPVKVPSKPPDSPEEVSLRQRYRRSSSNCATSAVSCSGSSSSGGSASVRQSRARPDATASLAASWAAQQVGGPYGSPMLAAASAAVAASASAAGQPAGPSRPTSPPVASLPPAWQQHQQPGSGEQTPRPQEGSQPLSARRRGSSFMRLLGKLSPFTKLQSPPATPADTLYQPALTRLGAKVEQGLRSSLDFPDLRQSTAPPVTPTAVTSVPAAAATAAAAAMPAPAAEQEEAQPARPPGDPAAAAAVAGDHDAGPEVSCTEAGAAQPAQPPLEEECSQGEAQVGMKRAPPSDMEQPNSSHKKRSPLPNRVAALAHEQEQQQPGQATGVGPRAGPSSAARGGAPGAARAGGPSAASGTRAAALQRPGRTQPPAKPWGRSPTKKGSGASPATGAARRSPTKQPATRLARPGRPTAAAQPAPANVAATSATGQAEDQSTQPQEQQPEGPSASSSSPEKAGPSSGSPQPSPRSADGGIAAWKPPSAAPQPHPISGLRQQSGSKLGYAQQAALRQGSYPGHRTNFISVCDAPPAPMWGPAPPLPPPGPSSQDPASPLPSPRSQQRPVGGSAGEEDPLQQQGQGPTFRQPAWHSESGPSPGIPPLPGRKTEGVEVTVLVGGIHAVHRQKQLERACSLSGLGCQQHTPSAAAEAAAGGGLSHRPTTESSPGVSYSPAAPAHSRQPSSVWPPVQGLPLRQDNLGRQLLEERPEYGELPAGRMLEMLGDGRVVHKSWVRPDFKRAGSLRIMRCVLGSGGRPVLEYPHGRGWRTLFGLVKKPLQTAIRRVIVPGAEWRPGHYIVVDTDRGMLRLEPTSKAQYTLWVLGLNAALHLAARAGGGRQGQGAAAGSSSPMAASRQPTEGEASSAPDGDGSLQLVADMLWHSNVMVG